MRIYDSLTRETREFVPIVPGHATIYVCGQTVYDAPHLGHVRKDVGFDIVVRWLEASGLKVTYVRNITDIDDKIIARARELREPIGSFTERMIARTRDDYAALGLRPPDHEPRATEYVGEMLDLAGALVKGGYAYAEGDLFYAVRKFAGYGKLSRRRLDDLRSGERVDIDGRKRDPLDFVLWKAAKPDEPEDAKWASPWGSGRPGWHLECSAMAKALLGETIDIHGGGPDLRFPHHENEIAQSEAANGQPLAHWWMHVGQLDFGGEKMSKSLGNFVTLRDAVEKHSGEVVRFFFVRSHYRSPIGFTESGLSEAAAALSRLATALEAHEPDGLPLDWTEPHADAFRAEMDNDFNTPGAVAVLFDLLRELNRSGSPLLARQLKGLCGVLRIGARAAPEESDPEVLALVAARDTARRARDFAEADRLRGLLESRGFQVLDGADGTRIRRG
ncbi:cysteine--tRNA ligase [uncultured Methylobacterium sp.]|jgi:cysteinyl-tRNA synthetase|uniref:cysteine--tRNA ligase n=1 Tax=uncultured Methylobacterium sp. TaxID=157278 RepID=UPI00260732AC|nr:cysteine--tRNA ligase [uncultured Methylobacterium sp.]